MQIIGQLKDDIINGQAVLFLGAGASIGAGLPSGSELADILFKQAGYLDNLKSCHNDLPRLVSRLDRNPDFTRNWVNNQLTKLFLENIEGLDFTTHKRLLALPWKAIFTTNYDCCLEIAEQLSDSLKYRLLPITDPNEATVARPDSPGKVKYFKLHGCCREIEERPTKASPLVITQSDFRKSIGHNRNFLEELRRYAFSGSIVFAGFQAQRVENNPILASILETYDFISSSFHESFSPYVVLPKVDSLTKEDITESGLNLLEGTFERFIGICEKITRKKNQQSDKGLDQSICIKASGREVNITLAEYQNYSSQFISYHENYLSDSKERLKGFSADQKAELWKSEPSDGLLATGCYIKRSKHECWKNLLSDSVNKVYNSKASRVVIITGKEASGKSVLARQLLAHSYNTMKQPALRLSIDASYNEVLSVGNREITMSGWDARIIDKFLSPFFQSDTDDKNIATPILLVDHGFHRLKAVEHLLSYLENHGKPVVLIMTLNSKEFHDLSNPARSDQLLKRYEFDEIIVPHKLERKELEQLFDVVSYIAERVRDKKIDLLKRGEDSNECASDILMTLYTWFDKKFRRLDQIIAEQISTMDSEPFLRNIYLTVAVFHQYHFSPNLSLCADALEISLDEVSKLRNNSSFRALIDLNQDSTDNNLELSATRHSEFSRQVIWELLPTMDEQVDLMCKMFIHCQKHDLEFVRSVFLYLCHREDILTIEQVERLKKATEKYLGDDGYLNHQFAAYLLRERAEYKMVRYYLDLAQDDSVPNSAVIHSIGHWCYCRCSESIENGDEEQAEEFFKSAKHYFAKSRALGGGRDEHAYFTDIDMTQKIAAALPESSRKSLLTAEQHALTMEALRTVPVGRQNLLRQNLGNERTFDQLTTVQRKHVEEEVFSEEASPLLVEYYANSLIANPSEKNWMILSKLISLYWDAVDTDPMMAIVICGIAKKGFIKNATSRFELLRTFFDELVVSESEDVNFVLLAEYIRLLHVDALVLEKFRYLQTTIRQVAGLFRDSKPRFLQNEFILKPSYYKFNETKHGELIAMFMQKNNWQSHDNAWLFEKSVKLLAHEEQRFFTIQMHPFDRFFIKGVRMETANRQGRVHLRFHVQHTFEGFLATNFKT